MLRRLTAERLNELAKLVGAWADINFKVHLPHRGFLEEVGEAAHCLIKRAQGIRGFEKSEYFKEQYADAIADAAIYLLHLCFRMKIPFASGSLQAEGSNPICNEENALYVLIMCAADFCNPEQDRSAVIQSAGDSLEMLATLANLEGIDFDEAVESTWDKVSKRDWVNNPQNADKVADSKAPGHKPGKKK